ncbi:hypothetical protein D3C76_1519460 [compost metagenome]
MRGGNLGFQIGGIDPQFDIEVALGVERDQLADVGGRRTDEQKVTLDLRHRALAEVQVVDTYFAKSHGRGLYRGELRICGMR